MLSVKFELDTSSRIRCPGQVGRAAAVEAGGLALVEAARAHDVGRVLAAAGVARVREAGGAAAARRAGTRRCRRWTARSGPGRTGRWSATRLCEPSRTGRSVFSPREL